MFGSESKTTSREKQEQEQAQQERAQQERDNLARWQRAEAMVSSLSHLSNDN